MSRFEKWILKGIFAKAVIQGPDHTHNITKLYSMIREACDEKFREDNSPTIDHFLLECFDKTQKSEFKGRE